MRLLATLLCLLLAPLVAQELGTIAGTVRDSTTGKPIPGAQVQAQGPGLGWRGAMADRNGRYTFDNLSPGPYQVFAFGYNYPGPLGLLQTGPRVTVEPGGSMQGVDVALNLGGSISGRVLSEDAVPLEGCRVTATTRWRPSPGVSGFVDAETDEDGAFRLGSLGPDYYLVAASCPDYLSGEHLLSSTGPLAFEPVAAWRKTYYPASPTQPGATPILVTAGSSKTIEFRLPRTAVHSIRGATDVPVAASPPCLALMTPADADPTEPRVARNAYCRGGQFQFHWVEPGSYQITLVQDPSRAGDSLRYGTQTVKVGETDPPPVTFHLQPVITLTGTVVAPPTPADETVRHPVTIVGDFSSLPGRESPSLRGFVSLNPLVRSRITGPETGTIQPADGSFSVTNLTPGDWEVSVQRSAGTEFLDSIEFGGQPVAGRIIHIAPGPAKPLVLKLSNRFPKLKLEWQGMPAVPIGRWSVVALPPPDSPTMNSVPVGTYFPGERFHLITPTPGRYSFLAVEDPLLFHARDGRLLDLLSRHVPVTEIFAGREQTVPVRCFTVDEVQRRVADYLRETNP